MKKILSLLLILIGVMAQSQDLPSNPEAGKCYLKCNIGEIKQWTEVPCDLTTPKARDTNYIKELQTLYRNLGYEIEITGIIDLNTIAAHKDYNNGMKKMKRKQRKAERRAKRKKKNQ